MKSCVCLFNGVAVRFQMAVVNDGGEWWRVVAMARQWWCEGWQWSIGNGGGMATAAVAVGHW